MSSKIILRNIGKDKKQSFCNLDGVSDEQLELCLYSYSIRNNYNLEQLKTLYEKDKQLCINAFLYEYKLHFFTLEEAKEKLTPETIYSLIKLIPEGKVNGVTYDAIREYICELIDRKELFKYLPYDLCARFKSRNKFISKAIKDCVKFKEYDIFEGVNLSKFEDNETQKMIVKLAKSFQNL